MRCLQNFLLKDFNLAVFLATSSPSAGRRPWRLPEGVKVTSDAICRAETFGRRGAISTPIRIQIERRLRRTDGRTDRVPRSFSEGERAVTKKQLPLLFSVSLPINRSSVGLIGPIGRLLIAIQNQKCNDPPSLVLRMKASKERALSETLR